MDFVKSVVDVISGIDPSMVVLLFMVAMGVALAIRAQSRDDFDWGEAFRNESKLVDWKQVGLLVSIGISSFLVVYVFMHAMKIAKTAQDIVDILHELFWYLTAYMAVWAMGPKFVEKIADAVLAKWGGPKTPPATG